jgi:hemerythrin superfamily protein
MAMDAIALLKQQHREVDELFERIQRSKADDEKIQLLGLIAERLTIHAEIEERHFYPFARSKGIQDLVDHSLKEHLEAKRLISEMLQLKRSDPRVDQDILQLITSVQQHVQEEENTFFPRLMTLVTQDDLVAVGDQMARTAEDLARQELLKLAERAGNVVPPVQP